MAENQENERRVSVESRITKVEMELEYLQKDITETKNMVGKIESAIEKLTEEFISARASFNTSYKLLLLVGSILVTLIGGAISAGIINLPHRIALSDIQSISDTKNAG